MLLAILVVVLILALVGSVPTWPHSRDWGPESWSICSSCRSTGRKWTTTGTGGAGEHSVEFRDCPGSSP